MGPVSIPEPMTQLAAWDGRENKGNLFNYLGMIGLSLMSIIRPGKGLAIIGNIGVRQRHEWNWNWNWK